MRPCPWVAVPTRLARWRLVAARQPPTLAAALEGPLWAAPARTLVERTPEQAERRAALLGAAAARAALLGAAAARAAPRSTSRAPAAESHRPLSSRPRRS